MGAQITGIALTGYILPEVCEQITETAADTLEDAGKLFRGVARRECPRSAINTPGYVHLQDTIGYDVDREGTGSQIWLTMYVGKSYARLVNDGTSRMPPRPYFTDGVLAVQDQYEELVRERFQKLLLGHTALPSNAGGKL